MVEFEGEELQSSVRILDSIRYECGIRNTGEKRWALGRLVDPNTLEPDECGKFEVALSAVVASLVNVGLQTSAQAAFDLQENT
jgi:hypothetical protein